jgi:hypothetical protein
MPAFVNNVAACDDKRGIYSITLHCSPSTDLFRALYPQALRDIVIADTDAVTQLQEATIYSATSKSPGPRWPAGGPMLIPLDQCTEGRVPKWKGIWRRASKNPPAEVPVIVTRRDGTQEKIEADWDEVCSAIGEEIMRPEGSTPRFAAVFELGFPNSNFRLVPPSNLQLDVLRPNEQKDVSANLGFKDQYINYHIDTGCAGITALAGKCQKIWLCAPPNKDNLALLTGENTSLAYLTGKLEDLATFIQTSSHAIFLPPGLIHATFTIESGILYGNNFRIRQHAWGATIGLLAVLKEPATDPSELRDVFTGWLETLERVASHGSEDEVRGVGFAIHHTGLLRFREAGMFSEFEAEFDRIITEHFPVAPAL